MSTSPQAPQPQPVITGFGGDFMSLGGVTSIPPQPSFSFGSGPTNPPPVPAQNNFGINLLGGQTTLQPTNVPAITPVNTGLGSGFKPIVNTNPNKFLAY